MFTVKVINYFGDEEHWSWDDLERLCYDYSIGDIVALPNDFDKVVVAYVRGVRIEVDTFGDFIKYIKENVGWIRKDI